MENDLLIKNIGKIVSGVFDDPIVVGDAIFVRDGIIKKVGFIDDLPLCNVAIDVRGATVCPGLIDSHVHPVIGDYTPRQKVVDFIASSVHGGVTRMISAGEVHMPGRPTGAVGTKALAIVGSKSWDSYRPGGMKMHGGGLLLQEGLQKQDFLEMYHEGVLHLGEVGLGGYHDWEHIAMMVEWAKQIGMVVMMHIGGASIPGSDAITSKHALMVRPDIASHLNGGPTAPSIADIEEIIVKTKCALEIIQCGNVAIIPDIIRIAKESDALNRIIIGTDMPSGTGVIPLGMLRTISWISGLCGIAPELAIAMATGNTADVYKISAGKILEGLEADLVIMDSPIGSSADDALDALRIGDTPGIAGVIIDGKLTVEKSRNTPPARRHLEVINYE